MRVVLAAAVLAATVLVTGCGGSRIEAASAPPWVQRANALCKPEDRRLRMANFDSMAMIMGLRREVEGLARLGFFKRVPVAASEMEIAGRLLPRVGDGNYRVERRIDKALIRARNAAAASGVHCSFAAFPLNSL
jgi:hypothetical protein